MIPLNKVMRISLYLKDGKKIPRWSMSHDESNFVQYKEGMTNFALLMSHYPDYIVLDLDSVEHPLDFYKNQTYTHRTRKGWHCFFKNTYAIKKKLQPNKQKLDVIVGDNVIYYNYNDPDVAFYKEHNQLPIIDMPVELYDLLKDYINPSDNTDMLTPVDADDFIIGPIVQRLMHTNLYNPKKGGWGANNYKDADKKEFDSSGFAFAVSKEALHYTDIPQHHLSVLQAIIREMPEGREVNKKHYDIPVDSPILIDKMWGRIPKGYREIRQKESLNFRPLSNFRIVTFGSKPKFLDIYSRQELTKESLLMCTVRGRDRYSKFFDSLNMFLPNYPTTEFMPDTNNMFVDKTYNLFHGFVDPLDGDEHELFLEYVLMVLCRGNTSYYDYIIKYLAHMVQKPNVLPQVAIVLYGSAKGTGKDTFHVLLSYLFNEGAYVEITKEMLERFNSPLAGCLLGSMEEQLFGGSAHDDNSLKTFITRVRHGIERKGVEGVQYVKNYVRLVITSNNDRPVKATDGERRYFVLEPSDKRKGDIEYWNELYNSFSKGHAANCLLHYLSTVDISEYSPSPAMDTEYLGQLISDNMSVIDDVLMDWWDNSAKNGDRFISKELYVQLDIHDRYSSPNKMMRALKKLVGTHHFKNGFNGDLGNHILIVDKVDKVPTVEELITGEK